MYSLTFVTTLHSEYLYVIKKMEDAKKAAEDAELANATGPEDDVEVSKDWLIGFEDSLNLEVPQAVARKLEN